MIISTDAEKELDKIQYPFKWKTYDNLGIEKWSQGIKATYDKSKTSITLNSMKKGWKLPKPRNNTRVSSVNISIQQSTGATRTIKKKK